MRIKISLLTALLLCLALLCACARGAGKLSDLLSETDPPSDTESKHEELSEETEVPTEDEPASKPAAEPEPEAIELAVLREQIRAHGYAVGAAFVDYIGSALDAPDITTYVSHDAISQAYPFLREAAVAPCEGDEVYAIVPADRSSVITVYPVIINDAGEVEVDRARVLCVGEAGAPLLLRCNLSDVYSNVLVSVSNGEALCEFSPMVSLRDGCTLVAGDDCFDFAPDNVRKHIEEAYEMLPERFTEIRDALALGKELIYAGEYYLCNQTMLRFELGTYDEDGFAWETQYAVSFDATYAMDPVNYRWYVLGSGLNQ